MSFTKNKISSGALGLILLCSVFTSCIPCKRIQGNGDVISLTQEVPFYTSVKSKGGAKIILVDGQEGVISLKGESNILPLFDVYVKDETLFIDRIDNDANCTYFINVKPLEVRIPIKNIVSVQNNGSGGLISEVELVKENFSVKTDGSGFSKIHGKIENLSIKSSGSGGCHFNGTVQNLVTTSQGSGSFKLIGKANTATMKNSGSGRMNAEGMIISSLDASNNGSGGAHYQVQEQLHLSVSGSGSVKIAGKATFAGIKVNGSGSVNAQALTVDNVEVKTNGSGSAKVCANKSIIASTHGSGSITYTGNPAAKNINSNGSGRVKQIGM